MNKKLIGLSLGVVAGILDVIPMILQDLTWDANLGAFSMWIVIGFFISSLELEVHPIVKGILVSLLVFLPNAFLIGWNDPLVLMPILSATIILGGALGYSVDWFGSKQNSIQQRH